MGSMKFTDFPPCKNRFICIQCRNDLKFIEHMKERFGEWQCPENIAMGTPLERMPDHIKNKINQYQKRLHQKGRDVPEIKPENKIGKKIDHNNLAPINRNFNSQRTKPNSFIETPGCTQRMMCVECRNNEAFREQVKRRMGDWECPENIPLGTPLNEMPDHIRDNIKKREDLKENRRKVVEDLRITLDAIEEVIPEKALGLIDKIRAHLFPDTKRPSLCKNHTGESIKVDKKCCGGKTRKVDGFVCKIHGDVHDRKCLGCKNFESNR